LRDLDEARRRSEEALDLSAGQAFGMPTQFARSDLVFTQLLAGDVGGAQAVWPSLWQGAEKATGWTTWLIAGRLAAARAQIALHAEPANSARDWAQRAIEIARRTKRQKYEAVSLTTLGEALGRLGQRAEAFQALQSAVAIADELIGAPGRWRARSALGRVAYALGDDETAAVAYDEAGALIETFAGTLAPQRAARFVAAPEISEILSLAGRTPTV
jgi:tetratricopeptide (TPR) repeat protein